MRKCLKNGGSVRVNLTERDRYIFKRIFENRVATRDQIGRLFFGNAKFQTVHRRLEKLVKAGFISKSSLQFPIQWHVYYHLEPKGLQEFGNSYHFPITRPLLKSDSVAHDLALGVIREQLQKKRMVKKYLSENVLQSCGMFLDSEDYRSFVTLNSDAALLLETTQGQFWVALEFEASDKEPSRYSKKLLEYYLSPKVTAVFYICENANIERLIRRMDMEIGQKFEPKVYTCLLQTFQNKNQPIPFMNRKNAKFSVL